MKAWALLLLAACAVPPGELALAPAVSLRVEARDGTLLREFASHAEGHAAPAHVSELPEHVWRPFVQAEDRRFFSHHGVDPRALLRAAWHDLRHLRFAEGGSTLTMQLARLVRPHPRTVRGKLAEVWFALRLERTLTKQQILDQYLTRVPLGNDVRGVEAAARLYFDKPARALNAEEARTLAAYVRRPARAPSQRVRRAFEAAHFVQSLRAPPDAVRLQTTLDLSLQHEVEAAVREQIAGLADKRVGSAAAIVIDNETSEVLAYVGSPDWFDVASDGRIDGVRTLRQPGSALKPFAYALAMQARGLTAATLLSDVESHFGDYMPKNYDRRAHGPVRARVALASSYNVPAVRVAEMVSPGELLRTLRRAGFDSLREDAEHYGLGLVLGDGEVSLLELARAYSGLARGGLARELRFVREADDASGRALPLPPPWQRRLFTPAVAAIIADILSDPAARAPAFGLDNALRFSFPVAAKTGTSRAFTDNWTAGYTRERTVAVWVGNMSGETMRHVSGITGAGPLFHRILSLAMAGVQKPRPLSDVALEEHDVCALSGELAGPACPGIVRERFIAGTAPREQCPMHGDGGLDLGPRFYDWAAHEGVRTLRGSSPGEHAELAFPRDGDEFLRGRDLPDEFQTIPVRVVARGAVDLQLDDGPRTPATSRVPARPGRHLLRVYRAAESTPDATVSFVVRG
ncbi:MAG TPA: transglycosylase domain-containing protein [Myxococcales bacterium]|nr:transglycosylase domain-containing protein [Myxococcales bacterium]